MNALKIFFSLGFIFMLHLRTEAALSLSSAALPGSSKTMEIPPVSKQELRIRQMKWFVSLSVADYEKLKGKKLSFFQRVSFKLSQHRMKQMLKYFDYGEPTVFQKISWLIKGLILGPIALALVYIFANEDERELIKWTWFGFAGWVVWVGIAVILLLH